MYKDKDRQREASKEAMRRYRFAEKEREQGVTKQGIVIPDHPIPVIPKTKVLPACVPEPVSSRYAKGEPEYMQTIDRLLAHTLDELKAMSIWIPVWRYTAGQGGGLKKA